MSETNIKKAYIVLSHIKKAIPRSRDFEMYETCHMVDKINKGHLLGSTAIIDVINKDLFKNRYREKTYEDYIEHMVSKYPDQYKKLLNLLGHELPEKLKDAVVESAKADETPVDETPVDEQPVDESGDTPQPPILAYSGLKGG